MESNNQETPDRPTSKEGQQQLRTNQVVPINNQTSPQNQTQTQQMQPVLGQDGRPIIGSDGQPVMRPVGQQGGLIQPMQMQMQPILGPDGRPQLGPDGRPLMRPVGQQVGMMQPGMMQPMRVGPNGQPMMQQPGMMQPMRVGPNGQPMMQGGGMVQQQMPGGPSQNQPGNLAQQRFMNPTGQARFGPGENPALNIDPNANGGTYQDTQECWGKCTGWCNTYLCCCCCEPPYKLVPQGSTGIIQRFGKFHKLVPPGMHYLIPELDTLVLVDKREQVFLLKKQVVQTRDNFTITIDALLFYKVVDSYKSKFAVTNMPLALKDLTETVLRNAIGKVTMQELLEKKEELSESIMEQVTAPAFNWGVAVTRALIQEIFFPREQLGNMSQGAIAKKIAEAKIIQSQADVESARLMKEASSILATEAAMQIRYIEALESIARTGNNKYVFFPADYREIGSSEL